MSDKKDHANEIISKDCNFVQNVRILALDDNPVCLKVLSALLRKCGYQFTTATGANEAYEILKKNRDKYDLVLTNVKNSSGDFKLVELMQLEMDIPVILISADDRSETMKKSIFYPIVREYIFKPVLYTQIHFLWQHVIKKANFQSTKISPGLKRQVNEITDTEGENEEKLIKKPRFNWTKELTKKFESAVNELGKKAVPKTILTKMNVVGLERSHVSSKLQKYRKSCAKREENDRIKDRMQQEAIRRVLSENKPEHRKMIAEIQAQKNLNLFADHIRVNPQNNVPSGNFIPMSPPNNFEPMRPNGPIQIPNATLSMQMAQNDNSRAMPPPSSSYGPMHVFVPNQSTQIAQPPQYENTLFIQGSSNDTPSPPKEQGSGPSNRASNSLSPSSSSGNKNHFYEDEIIDCDEFAEILAMINDDSSPTLATSHQLEPSFSSWI